FTYVLRSFNDWFGTLGICELPMTGYSTLLNLPWPEALMVSTFPPKQWRTLPVNEPDDSPDPTSAQCNFSGFWDNRGTQSVQPGDLQEDEAGSGEWRPITGGLCRQIDQSAKRFRDASATGVIGLVKDRGFGK
ncbi:MAG: hypothetical protein VYE28_06995, partial [Planctomycetota bacterium]|nr:hypothetical protein [Planctomycetota bacterium]